MKNLVITIGRQYGSGGREFGKKLADALGIAFYDEEIVTLTAEKNNLSPEISKTADEQASNSLLYSLATGGAFRGMFNGYYEMPLNDKFFIAQSKIIKQLAHEGSCVMVGRCANYVLRDDDEINKIDLFIYADMDYRINRIKGIYNLDDTQAKNKIVKTEKKRRTYYNYYSNGNWGHTSEYDLCINLAPITHEDAIEMIKIYAKKIAD